MDLDEAIEKRRSTRSFKDKKASWKSVLEAIDAAAKAPFAGNYDHLKFIIIEDKEKIAKIARLSEQHWIADSGIMVIVCSDNTHLARLYGERGKVYSRQESGAAIQNFLLKIIDLGLSACWVGAFPDEMIEQLLKVPNHIRIEAIIPVGYEKEKTKAPRKKALETLLFWEEWGNNRRPTLFEESIHERPRGLK